VNQFLKYYHLEQYLFSHVSERFQQNHVMSAFDFFCIIIWKANRAKSKIAKRMLARGHANLQCAFNAVAGDIANAPDHSSRLEVLIDRWGFRLPMASAILTVLYPDEFTVYDVRVCDVLGDFHDAATKTRFADIWSRYSEYLAKVRESAPEVSSLRDKDRSLWGQSFASQLEDDIAKAFGAE